MKSTIDNPEHRKWEQKNLYNVQELSAVGRKEFQKT
jgi:hypothetical protein